MTGLTLMIALATGFQACRPHEDPDTLAKSSSPVYISEYMIPDQWVELYNPADTAVNTTGYLIMADGHKYRAGKNSLEPGEYMLIRGIHAMDEGEMFYLKDGDGCLVDIIRTPKFKKYKSIVRKRLPDGSFSEHSEERITPGYPNTLAGYYEFSATLRKDNHSGVIISEIMADNDCVYADRDGNFVDYIELYNASSNVVDLGGFGLTDKEAAPHLYRIPDHTKLNPGQYLLVNCSSQYQDASQGAPFSISNGEESVYFTDKDGYIIDEYGPVSMQENQSLVRLKDGGAWITTWSISPGYPNTDSGAAEYARLATLRELPDVHISEAFPGSEDNGGWVELFNRSGSAVNLQGYSLVDDKPDKHRYEFKSGATIPAKGRLMVYSGKSGKGIATGYPFRKCAQLSLCSPEGDVIDRIVLSDVPQTMSKGRSGNALGWSYYRTPTPNASNGSGAPSIAMAPIASVASGQYDGVDEITVELSAGAPIYYTLDGSIPSRASTKYSGPLHLTKTSVVRAIAIPDEALNSPVSSYTYLINEGHKLDVFSLVSNPDGLFSASSGIYSNGGHTLIPHGQEGEGVPGIPYPYLAANFWRKWVRQANISYLPQRGEGFSYDCGASIFGGYSRINAKKSFKFKFKRQYGTGKLHYKLFEERDFSDFDCIVMRTGGQDAYGTLIKDDLTSYLMDPLIDVMATKPVIFYVNGQYYGVYFLREKVNRDFIASHYGVPTEKIDIIQGNQNVEAGSKADYSALLSYVKSNDMSKASAYEWVCDRMDVLSYIDWIIAEIYVGNHDAGNVRVFRSPYIDNKWHWLLYDVDISYGGTRSDAFMIYIKPTQQMICQTDLIRRLMKNKDFRALFMERLEYQMHNIWNRENVLAGIDYFVDQIEPEMERNQKRWGVNTYQTWVNRVNNLRDYANGRQAYLREMFATNSLLKEVFHMSREELDRCFEK